MTERVPVVVFPDVKRIAREAERERQRAAEEESARVRAACQARRNAKRPGLIVTLYDADGRPVKP